MTRPPVRVVRRLAVLAFAALLGAGPPATSGGPTLVIRDIPYAERDGRVLTLDVYRSADAYGDPALVLVHGGSWRRRSKDVWSTLAPRYAAAGFVVFAIDYRLAPPGGNTRFPAPRDDVEAAIEWVRARAPEYGGDPDKVAVAGSSAGAHLALLAAGSEGARPDAAVLFSPPVRLRRLHDADVLRRPIENFVGCPPDACPAPYRQASGLTSVDPMTPPVLVAFSKHELIPRSQPMALMRRMRAFDRSFVHLELRGERHGMAVASRTFEETVRFLNGRL